MQLVESDDPIRMCESEEVPGWFKSLGINKLEMTELMGHWGVMRSISPAQVQYSSDWASSVPDLLKNVVALLTEKRKQELRFALLEITNNEFEKRINRLESIQTQIVPIDSFGPEPYILLKPILVAVHSVEGGFDAGWFDANMHFSGDNEEEAVSNLKGFILDSFESFSDKYPDKLGPEPTRQLAIMREYIQKKP
jgi:hypothetical protein